MIVDPHGHIDDEDRRAITMGFEQARGTSKEGGPPMYVVSPNDRGGVDDSLVADDPNQVRQNPGKESTFWEIGRAHV